MADMDAALPDRASHQTPRRGPIRRVRRWLSTDKPLAHALVVVVAFGLIVAFIAWVVVSWILGQGLPWTSSTDQTSRLDVTKLALTVVGGAGAFVALTVAYRRQKDLEDGRFTERFGAAAAQLGAATPAERLAGVYAMAGVADRYPAFGQQCIDVLCGYLRLPFDPDPDLSHLTTVVTHHRLDTDGAHIHDRTYQLLANDREVRDTIVRVVAAHVRADRDPGWHEHDFDFTGAILNTAQFDNSHFGGSLDCSQARFVGRSRFNGTTFTGPARFDGALFTEDAGFAAAEFNGSSSFSRVRFEGSAWFDGTTFNGHTWFTATSFMDDAGFAAAKFTYAWFTAATFHGVARFEDSSFNGTAGFQDANFDLVGESTSAPFNFGDGLPDASLAGPAVRFGGATFTGSLTRTDGTTTRGSQRTLGPALGFPSDAGPETASG